MKTVQQKWVVIVAMAFMLCLAGLIMTGTAFGAGGQETDYSQCVDNKDGTITDKKNSLMWQKATAGPMNWDQAKSYASGLSLGGHSGWRLPAKDELNVLRISPCKDMMDVARDWYWASSSIGSDSAWLVSFEPTNIVYDNLSKGSGCVRAVRAGQ